MSKSGYVALVGRTNVGKSTLINAIIGESVAIVTNKPQTTRDKIRGIKTLPQGQIIILDTPGLHDPHRELNEYMVAVAEATLSDADVILCLLESPRGLLPEDEELIQKIIKTGKPYIIVLNKSDLTDMERLKSLEAECQKKFKAEHILKTNAKRLSGVEDLEKLLFEFLPEGEPYYSEDIYTDQNYRILSQEIIREQAFELLGQELPYSLTVMVTDYKEPRGDKIITRIAAEIIVERDSQKGMVIGSGGKMIKQIGQNARKKIEKMIGSQVFLDLRVRVDKDWSHNPAKLKKYGYFSR